jgi:hypothetical protein
MNILLIAGIVSAVVMAWWFLSQPLTQIHARLMGYVLFMAGPTVRKLMRPLSSPKVRSIFLQQYELRLKASAAMSRRFLTENMRQRRQFKRSFGTRPICADASVQEMVDIMLSHLAACIQVARSGSVQYMETDPRAALGTTSIALRYGIDFLRAHTAAKHLGFRVHLSWTDYTAVSSAA